MSYQKTTWGKGMHRAPVMLIAPFVVAVSSATGQSPVEVPIVMTRLELDVRVNYESRSLGGTATVAIRNGGSVAVSEVQFLLNRLMTASRVTHRSIEPVPFLNISIAPYRVTEGDGFRIFAFPEDSAGAAVVSAAVTNALTTLTRWYGSLVRQPDIAVMEIPEGFGSQASLSAGIILTADSFRDRAQLRQLYHELSHLWNPPDADVPSPRWNEGLATFLQWRLAAELDGWSDWNARLESAAQSLVRRCQPVNCATRPLAEYGRAGMTDLSYPVGFLCSRRCIRR